MKLMRLALTGSLLLVLAACGNNSPVSPPTNPNPPTNPGTPTNPPGGLPGGIPGLPTAPPTTPTPPTTPETSSISGTITAPPGGDVSGTIIIACYNGDINKCLNVSSDGTFTDGFSGAIRVTQSGSSSSYVLNGLQAVQFVIIAARNSNGNGRFDDAVDYIGAYPSVSGAQLVTSPATGIDITMQTFGDIANPNPTPTPGNLTGTWTGTTTTTTYGVEQTTFGFTQSGSSVSGTLALDGTGGAVSTDITGSVNGSSVTISAPFSLVDPDGNQTGTLTYTYEGTVSGSTFSGAVMLSGGSNQEQGQFTVTQSSAATAPLGKFDAKALSRVFENIR